MTILRWFFVLLVFQGVGEAVHTGLRVPLPGPVIGMALLAACLLLRGKEPEAGLQQTADGLLGWLGLLFVPAGVGIVANLSLLRAAWLPVSVGLVGSTLLTLVATAGVMHGLTRPRMRGGKA